MIEKITDWPFPRITDEWKRGNTNFFEITQEVFEQQLGVLPPMRPEWGASYSMFFCPEEFDCDANNSFHMVYIEIKVELPTDSRFFCKVANARKSNLFYMMELQETMKQLTKKAITEYTQEEVFYDPVPEKKREHKYSEYAIFANEKQIEALNNIVKRYEKEPNRFWLDLSKDDDGKLFCDTLMVDFGFILIGIEKDGYTHS